MKVPFVPLLVCTAAVTGNAATVVRPSSIVSLTGADAFFPSNNIINGSGLSAPLNTGDTLVTTTHDWNVNAAADSWVSSAPGGYPSNWFAATGSQPVFVFDLGADRQISDIHLWAYSAGATNGYQGNSARDLTFRFNTAAQGFAAFTGSATAASMDHALHNSVPPGPLLPRQDFAIGSTVTARYVQMTITSNWFTAPGNGTGLDIHGHGVDGGDRIGLGEVRFSLVPEPATALLAGLAGLVLSRRRR